MALEEPNENDKIKTIEDVDFLINERALPYTDEKKLDYVSAGGGEGFVIVPAFGSGC